MKIRAAAFVIVIAIAHAVSFDALAMAAVNKEGPGSRRTGTVEAITPGYSIRIGGVTYVFAASLAKVHNEMDGDVAQVNLTKGMAVSFLVKPDGSKERITEIWVLKK
jgi:hypothetical protein